MCVPDSELKQQNVKVTKFNRTGRKLTISSQTMGPPKPKGSIDPKVWERSWRTDQTPEHKPLDLPPNISKDLLPPV